jgi:hypothetical protein
MLAMRANVINCDVCVGQFQVLCNVINVLN